MNKILGVAWENIFVGLLGAGIVGLLAYIKSFVKDKLIEKKFPVAGEYLTKYEDESDGKIIECSAPAVLKQKGKKIYGYTNLTEENRKWIIEGEISTNGHIYGIYYAEDPIDKGIGNFFLKVDNKRNMYGLWSGYDSVNEKITSGKYIFRHVYKEFNIINLVKEYIPQLIDISDIELGRDYLTYEMLERVINNPDKYVCKLVYSLPEKRVLGFCLCLIIEPSEIESTAKLSVDQIPRAVKYSEKIGVIKTVAVERRFQGKGIGRRVIEDCYKELLKRKVQSVFSAAWKNKEHINVHGILSALGFRKFTEVENYWSEESIQKGYLCPACGEPPCRCSAVIYTKSVFNGDMI